MLLVTAFFSQSTSSSLLTISSSSSGSVAPLSSRVCVQDAVVVTWAVSNWTWGTELVWIEVRDPVGAAIARFDLFQARVPGAGEASSSSLEIVDAVPKTLEMVHSVIHSLDYGVSKIPHVRTVRMCFLFRHENTF